MREWLIIFMVIVGSIALSFLIISGLVWLVLWCAPAIGLSVPAFSWKICILVYLIVTVIQNIFKIESPIKIKITH